MRTQGILRSLCMAVLAALPLTVTVADDGPDVRSMEPDLVCPTWEAGRPAPGKRVPYVGNAETSQKAAVQAALMLPENWTPDRKWPVFVELPGNGGYRDARGDECSGQPEDCCLGYGLTAGRDWIWVCLPFLNGDGSQVAKTWWGDPPGYDPSATLKFWNNVLEQLINEYGGDGDCFVLAGFSRGAIAVNALGLRNSEISRRWKAFLPNSHYDGVRRWPFPDSDRQSAAERLRLLGHRPQLITGEGNQVAETRRYLQEADADLTNVEFLPTGFLNHTDRWSLRPCPARAIARNWLRSQASQN